MSSPFVSLPFGDNPGRLYPVASQDTCVSHGSFLTGVGGGGGAVGGTVDSNLSLNSLSVSTITDSTGTNKIQMWANDSVIPNAGSSLLLTGRDRAFLFLDGEQDYIKMKGAGADTAEGGCIRFPINTQIIKLNEGCVIDKDGKVATASVSTSALVVSSINGQAFGNTGSLVPTNITVSSIALGASITNANNNSITLKGANNSISLASKDGTVMTLDADALGVPNFNLQLGPVGTTPGASVKASLGQVKLNDNFVVDANANLYLKSVFSVSSINFVAGVGGGHGMIDNLSTVNGFAIDWMKLSTLIGNAP